MDSLDKQHSGMSREFGGQRSFEVIDPTRLQELKAGLEQKYHIPIGNYRIAMMYPGDDEFVVHEVQYKLYSKVNSWEELLAVFRKHGYDPEKLPANPVEVFKDVASKEEVEINGTLPGFALSAGNDEILFAAIREDQVVDMAQKYAKKEQDELNMPQTLDESKAYLRKLTEKFFYHEAGHIFYKHFLPDNLKGWWEDFIKGNNQIAQEVIRVQEDKYPSEDEIPVAEEAFTDIFAEVVTEGRTQNRIGHHPEAVEAMETILKQFEKRAG